MLIWLCISSGRQPQNKKKGKEISNHIQLSYQTVSNHTASNHTGIFILNTHRHINAIKKRDLYCVKKKKVMNIKSNKSPIIVNLILEISIQTLGEEFCNEQIRLTKPKPNTMLTWLLCFLIWCSRKHSST